jgi:hypothetical protein
MGLIDLRDIYRYRSPAASCRGPIDSFAINARRYHEARIDGEYSHTNLYAIVRA